MQRIDIEGYLTSGQGSPTDDELRELYAYPTALPSPWIRVNFVASVDGAVDADGTSGGLGTPADRRIFTLLRELADVVVVGAATARAENYGGARPDAPTRQRRLALGQSPVPPILVVTAGANLDPSSRLFRDTEVPPIVVTGHRAPPPRVLALRSTGADVVVVDDDAVTTSALVAVLTARGLHRVLCEGGPSLHGQLLGDDVVDELCLTTSPLLVAGTSRRIAASPSATPRPMRPASMLADTDGTILTRWVRDRPGKL